MQLGPCTTMSLAAAKRRTASSSAAANPFANTIAARTCALEAAYEVLDWYADDAISGAGVDERLLLRRQRLFRRRQDALLIGLHWSQ